MPDLLTCVADIASSYVANHEVRPEEMAALVTSIRDALSGEPTPRLNSPVLFSTVTRVPATRTTKEPAVPIARSVFNGHIVCLECGREGQMLKQHINTSHGQSPDDYRAKWGLPATYPMVCPTYSRIRSKIAREGGLGRRT